MERINDKHNIEVVRIQYCIYIEKDRIKHMGTKKKEKIIVKNKQVNINLNCIK